VLALSTGTTAQQAGQTSERFSFTASGMSTGADGEHRLNIVVRRWSTEAERDRVLAALTGSLDQPHHELRRMDEAGHIEWPGATRYTLRYAHQTTRPDGGQDIMLATEAPLWLWWDSTRAAASTKHPFTVVQLRLTKEGSGEGRLSLAGKIAADQTARSIVIENFAEEPAILTNVRREQSVNTD
jgi:hypothetical protein